MAKVEDRAGFDTRWGEVRRLLVMRLDNIGDVVMASPVLRAIKETLPDVHLTLMASPAGAQVAPLLPWVDEVLVRRVLWQDLGKLEFDPEREWQLVATLREGRYDAGIILTSFSQTPYPAALLLALAGVPLRLGAPKEAAIGLLTDAAERLPEPVHQVERNLQLLRHVGFPVADDRLELFVGEEHATSAQRKLAEHGVGVDEPYLLLTPWASCPARTYHADRFAAASLALTERTGLRVVVCGAPRDRDRRMAILEPLGKHGVDLVGETTVPELAALALASRLVLTNDSLPMHLADALETPSVVLYSGTEYETQWRPRYTRTSLLRRPTWCSPCYAFTCPYDLECLDIPAEEVAVAGLALLGEPVSR